MLLEVWRVAARERASEIEGERGREVDDRNPQGNVSTDQPFRFAHAGEVAGEKENGWGID